MIISQKTEHAGACDLCVACNNNNLPFRAVSLWRISMHGNVIKNKHCTLIF